MDRKIADVTEYLTLDPLKIRLDAHRRYSKYPDDVEAAVLGVAKVRSHDDVLDIGSGTGSFLRRLAADGHSGRLVGLDMSPAAVLELAGITGVEGHQGDATRLPFATGVFQAAFARHMLYHVPDVPAALAEASRVLAPEGKFVASVNHPFTTPKMRDLVIGVVTRHGFVVDSASPVPVHSDNLPAMMSDTFGNVEVHRFDNALVFDSPELITAFCVSNLAFYGVDGDSPLRPAVVADIRVAATLAFESDDNQWVDPNGYVVCLARKTT